MTGNLYNIEKLFLLFFNIGNNYYNDSNNSNDRAQNLSKVFVPTPIIHFIIYLLVIYYLNPLL